MPGPPRTAWSTCARRSSTTMKPQRVYQCMNRNLDKDTCYVSTIGLSQDRRCPVPTACTEPRHWINCGQAGHTGWMPALLSVRVADRAGIVALSGDYGFQFMIEELAVGALIQSCPTCTMLVSNSYLGLITPGAAARLQHRLLRAARFRQHQAWTRGGASRGLRRGRAGRRGAWNTGHPACTARGLRARHAPGRGLGVAEHRRPSSSSASWSA